MIKEKKSRGILGRLCLMRMLFQEAAEECLKVFTIYEKLPARVGGKVIFIIIIAVLM